MTVPGSTTSGGTTDLVSVLEVALISYECYSEYNWNAGGNDSPVPEVVM